ncbi:FecR family protein [Pseudoteredinibacter isoporae]|uniref:FecR family protein n=1 Tax=Pseudoteredinibacter isoporae TaxID=570281 RepID=UPI003109B61C
MSKVSQLTPTEDCLDQASEWLAKVDRGLSDEEQQAMHQWVHANPNHRRSLFEMAALWDSMSMLSELSAMFPLEEAPAKRTALAFPVAAAACLAALAIGLSLLWVNNNLLQQATFTTAIGEHSQYKLNDGSTIHLNTNSRLRIDFDLGERRVYLEQGEAHFTVAHDKRRPFIVEAGDNTITAIGTAFNIQLSNQKEMELLVTEGKVSLQGPQTARLASDSRNTLPTPVTTYLSAGQKVASSEQKISSVTPIESETIDGELAWQRGFIVFDGAPLRQAMSEVERYSELSFTMDDDIQALQIAGFFKTNDTDKLLNALEESFGIVAERREQSIHLRQP